MRTFILGTDWWTDCDDVVALRMIDRMHKVGKIYLKGVVINACADESVASLDGFLSLDGVENIPIGIDLSATEFQGAMTYQKRLVSHAKTYKKNSDAIDGVRLYRQILAQTKEKIEIIEIGYLQAIADLLESDGDDLSPLCGKDLVEEKVSKIWVMAGKWDEDGGLENNFCRNKSAMSGGERFCRLCPVPVTFLGWEVGCSVITGGKNVLDQNDPLCVAMCDHGSDEGRSSWDPMVVALALEGDEEKAGYKCVCGKARVDADTGACHFDESADGLHKYVVKVQKDEYYKNLINDLIK